MHDPNSTIDRLIGLAQDATKDDVINLIASVNGKTRKVQPQQLKNLIGGGGASGDFIPAESMGVPDGVATLNAKGFVPSAQLDIGSASGPFIVEDWNVENTTLVEPAPTSKGSTEFKKVGDVSTFSFKKPSDEDIYLKNSFYNNTKNNLFDYKNGLVTLPKGPVEVTTPDLPFGFIGFNNVGNFKIRLSQDEENFSSNFVLILTRSVDINEMLSETDPKAPMSFTIPILNNYVYTPLGVQHNFNDGNDLIIKRDSNKTLQIIINNIVIETIDIAGTSINEGKANPDMVWNIFLALTDQTPESINNSLHDYKINLTNDIDFRFGGAHYRDCPDNFSVEILPFENNPYYYAWLISDKVEVNPLDLIDGGGVGLSISPSMGIIFFNTTGSDSIQLPYDPTQKLLVEFDAINKLMTINGVSYPQTKLVGKWKSSTALFMNIAGNTILDNPATMSYKLDGYLVEKTLPAIPPEDAKDGKVFKIINNGLYNEQTLVHGDFATFYNNLQDVIVTRIPKEIDINQIETMLDFRIAAALDQSKKYTDEKTANIKTTYRGAFVGENNIWVEDPHKGDYVLVGENIDYIKIYYYNGQSWVREDLTSQLNSDQITEGQYNRFLTLSSLLPMLTDNGFLNITGINEGIRYGTIYPGGTFESTGFKVEQDLETMAGDARFYPNVKAVIDYVNSRLTRGTKTLSGERNILSLTTKEAKLISPTEKFRILSNTTNAGSTNGKVVAGYKFSFNEDPAYPSMVNHSVLDFFDGWCFTLSVSSGPLFSNETIAKIGLSFNTGNEDVSNNYFVGVKFNNSVITVNVDGQSTPGWTPKHYERQIYPTQSVVVRFTYLDNILTIDTDTGGGWSRLDQIKDFDKNYLTKYIARQMSMYSDMSNGGAEISNIKLIWQELTNIEV